MIRAHQPGSEPIDIPETIPNPVVVPKPTPTPTEPAPRSQFAYRRRFPRAASQPQQDACAGRNGRYESVPLVGYRCDGFPGLALSG